ACRLRIRAGAHGTDLEGPRVVAIGDTAAAGTHFHSIDDREHHRLASSVSANVVTMRHLRLAVARKIRFRGGAPHIETNNVGISERCSCSRRGDESTYRTGLEHRSRQLP